LILGGHQRTKRGDVSIKENVFFPRTTVCTAKVRIDSTTENKVVQKESLFSRLYNTF